MTVSNAVPKMAWVLGAMSIVTVASAQVDQHPPAAISR